jgi:ribosome-binding protein aMBF1 (putative translation factor)
MKHWTTFRRCQWCGKAIFTEPVTAKQEYPFTIICDDCFRWEMQTHGIVITLLDTTKRSDVISNPLEKYI